MLLVHSPMLIIHGDAEFKHNVSDLGAWLIELRVILRSFPYFLNWQGGDIKC